MASTGSYVSAVVDPRPRVSTPRPPPLPGYLNWRTGMTEAGSQDGHRLYDRHLPETTPRNFVGAPVCISRREVQWTPLRQSQSSGSPGRSEPFQPKLHYRYVQVPCVERGGDSSSLVVDALANATSTRHPSRGWVNTVSAWGAIRNLVIGDAQDAQRRMLIINIKMIELY